MTTTHAFQMKNSRAPRVSSIRVRNALVNAGHAVARVFSLAGTCYVRLEPMPPTNWAAMSDTTRGVIATLEALRLVGTQIYNGDIEVRFAPHGALCMCVDCCGRTPTLGQPGKGRG